MWGSVKNNGLEVFVLGAEETSHMSANKLFSLLWHGLLKVSCSFIKLVSPLFCLKSPQRSEVTHPDPHGLSSYLSSHFVLACFTSYMSKFMYVNIFTQSPLLWGLFFTVFLPFLFRPLSGSDRHSCGYRGDNNEPLAAASTFELGLWFSCSL